MKKTFGPSKFIQNTPLAILHLRQVKILHLDFHIKKQSDLFISMHHAYNPPKVSLSTLVGKWPNLIFKYQGVHTFALDCLQKS